jgi:hypothetical protein
MKELLDSFIFDITLFENNNSDYCEADPVQHITNEFTTKQMVTFSQHAILLYNMMKDTYILNKYEIKGLLLEYAINHFHFPISSIYMDRTPTGRLLRFVDKTINLYLKLQSSHKRKDDRLREFIINIGEDLFKSGVILTP